MYGLPCECWITHQKTHVVIATQWDHGAPTACSLNSYCVVMMMMSMSNTHTLFWWCHSEKYADSPVCLAPSLEDASQQMHSPVFGAPPIALSSTLSLLGVHSSTCFPAEHSHALSSVDRALARFPPPLLAALHVSAERHRLLYIIGSFLLALPLHHSLTGLSQSQRPAPSAAPSSRSSLPQHESFMNQWLFSALIGEGWVQTSDSLKGGEALMLDSNREEDQLAGLQISLIRLLSNTAVLLGYFCYIEGWGWWYPVFFLLSTKSYEKTKTKN